MKLIFRFKGLLKSRTKHFESEEEADNFISDLESKNLVDFGNEVLNINDIKKISKRF